MSLLTPVASVMRAAFVSVNLFSLLCQGDSPAQTNEMGDIMRFGGPIVYLIGQILFYFAILVWKDAGAALRKVKKGKTQVVPAGLSDDSAEKRVRRDDVREEEVRVADSEDILKVMKVSKSFDGKRVVDDVSFGAERGTMLALLGPNGAGKTTTFNMIRGSSVAIPSRRKLNCISE
jgi:ATP-binding cassette subfamily A (ABC1) protein 3